MGIILGDLEINDANFLGYDDEISREFEQPDMAPTKVRESDAFDETKLDARLQKAIGAGLAEVALMVVHHWMLDEENGWRKGSYDSGLRVANSLKTIREYRMRNR